MLKSRSSIPLVLVGCFDAGILYFTSQYLVRGLESFHASLVISVVALFVGYLTWDYCQILFNLSFNGPIPLPLLGNALDMTAKENMQTSIRAIMEKYGPLVEIVLPGKANRIVIVTSDIAVNRTTMTKTSDRGSVNPNWERSFRSRFILKELFDKTDLDMLFLSGDDWKTRRKLLQPAFDQKHVRAMLHAISDIAHDLVVKLEQEANKDGGAFNILPELQNFGLEVLCKTNLGMSMNLIQDPSSCRWIIDTFKENTDLHTKCVFDPLMSIKVGLLPWLGLNPQELERRKKAKKLTALVNDLVQKEKKLQQDAANKKDNKEDDGGVDNLLSLTVRALLEHPDKLKDHNVVDELRSFMYAGYDTTSLTLSVFLYHIATHPECQARLHEEISSAFSSSLVGSANKGAEYYKNVNFARVMQEHPLPYLSACIRESQRIQPVAPVLSRRLQQDIQMDYGPDKKRVVLKKGSRVFIPVHIIHRNESQYPEPESFKPERWIETVNGVDKIKSVPHGYFYAFGGGPKMCVGFQLAEKQLKLTAMAIIGKFRVEKVEEMVIRDSLVSGPLSMKLRLTKYGKGEEVPHK